ncbi:MAG: acetylglutamate kinase [Candidatus Ratteibacteria bacterium]|nr:acetylglutamate kinase [Candidatus Ratteibacteria bacterium]
MQKYIEKVEILIEALPYIKKFRGKKVVVKYGGSTLAMEGIKRSIMQDLIFMHTVGIMPVLVHGGGPLITEKLKQMGKKTEFIDGMRATDKESLAIVEDVLFKEINRGLVDLIKQLGGKAGSINGKDFIQASIHNEELGLVGKVKKINPEIIIKKKNLIPVISPLGADKKQILNVNADVVAGELAVALKAEKLVLLTDVKGIMRNSEDETSLLSTLKCDEADDLIKNNIIARGMIPKVGACIAAIKGGVKKAHIVDGRLPHSILLEIFTDKGIGTEIVR